MRSFLAACIQLNSQHIIAENIATIERLCLSAVEQGAALLSLPENAFQMEKPGAPRELYTEDKHPGVLAMRAFAAKHSVSIIIGSAAILPDTPPDDEVKPYNRSIYINRRGDIVARYDKMHLFDAKLPNGESYDESARYRRGTLPTIAESQKGKMGMTICYDVRFPYIYRHMAQQGVNVLSIPASFAYTTGEAHWHVLLRARAIENGAYVLASAQCGVHPNGRKTYGHSLIIDPWGTVLAEADEQPGVICATIDDTRVAATRQMLPALQHSNMQNSYDI